MAHKLKIVKRREVHAFLTRQQQTIAASADAPQKRTAMQSAADFLFAGRDVKRVRVDRENQWFRDLARIANPRNADAPSACGASV